MKMERFQQEKRKQNELNPLFFLSVSSLKEILQHRKVLHSEQNDNDVVVMSSEIVKVEIGCIDTPFILPSPFHVPIETSYVFSFPFLV